LKLLTGCAKVYQLPDQWRLKTAIKLFIAMTTTATLGKDYYIRLRVQDSDG